MVARLTSFPGSPGNADPPSEAGFALWVSGVSASRRWSRARSGFRAQRVACTRTPQGATGQAPKSVSNLHGARRTLGTDFPSRASSSVRSKRGALHSTFENVSDIGMCLGSPDIIRVRPKQGAVHPQSSATSRFWRLGQQLPLEQETGMHLLIIGVVVTIAAWILAWSRAGVLSEYSFFLLWIGYILTVNGISNVAFKTSLLRVMRGCLL